MRRRRLNLTVERGQAPRRSSAGPSAPPAPPGAPCPASLSDVAAHVLRWSDPLTGAITYCAQRDGRNVATMLLSPGCDSPDAAVLLACVVQASARVTPVDAPRSPARLTLVRP